jgi:hypothetical protein
MSSAAWRPMAMGLILACLCSQVQAIEPLINTDESNVAIHGYDPVAYFVAGEARLGSPQQTTLWQGAQWRFESEANLQRFVSDPQRYAPRYGGFCAYAVSYGQTADIDPAAWTIIDGRLYLNFSERVRQIWRPRTGEFIPDADILWPTIVEDRAQSSPP